MSVLESMQAATGLDSFMLANVLFFAMVMTIWLVMAILEKRDKRPLPPRAHWSGIGSSGSEIGPKFPGGWICRTCWTANRGHDSECIRCHSAARDTSGGAESPPLRFSRRSRPPGR